MRAKTDRIIFLRGRSRENDNVRPKGAGELHGHVAETAQPDDANLFAWADFLGAIVS